MTGTGVPGSLSARPPREWLEPLLEALPAARVAVFGDFALDAYWMVEGDSGELSLETGLPVVRVRSQRYAPGGAANVVANLRDLGVGRVRAVGVLGDDLFGRELEALLAGAGADVRALRPRQADWLTQVFAKPLDAGREQRRLDFGSFNELSRDARRSLELDLEQAVEESDVVILNQQVPRGVSTPAMIATLNAVIARHPGRRFVVDSRDRPGAYAGSVLKINDVELLLLAGAERRTRPIPLELTRRAALAVHAGTGEPLFITRGEEGILVVDQGAVHVVGGHPQPGPVDPVGAGDTAVSALAAALAAGADGVRAAELANAAAAISVRK